MSSSVNRRIFRSPEAEEDVVVVGESVRRRLASDDPIATVTTLLAGANQRVEAIVAEARARAEAIVAEAGEVAAAEARAAAGMGVPKPNSARRSGSLYRYQGLLPEQRSARC